MAKRSREDFEPTPPPPSTSPSSPNSPSEVAERAISYPGISSSSDPNAHNSSSAKLQHIDLSSGEGLPATTEVMKCSLPPHKETLSFTTFEDYEVHYNKTHVNRCIECRKNFPTPHFLNLHQEENHDPLIEVLRERGERTYSCLVETCDRKCSTPQKRRMHLIDKHLFPKDYDFHIINDGIDNRSTMLRSGRNSHHGNRHRRRSSAALHKVDIEERARRRISSSMAVDGKSGAGEMDEDEDEDEEEDENEDDEDSGGIMKDKKPEKAKTKKNKDKAVAEGEGSDGDGDEMEGLTGAMSALKFVPHSIRFGRGRGRGRGGFSRS